MGRTGKGKAEFEKIETGIYKCKGGIHDGMYQWRAEGYYSQEEIDSDKRIKREYGGKKGWSRTKKQARIDRQNWIASHKVPSSSKITQPMTFEDLMNYAFDKRLKTNRANETTVMGNKNALKKYANNLMKLEARKITVNDIVTVYNGEEFNKLTTSTKNRISILMSLVFEDGIVRKTCTRNPVKEADYKFKKTTEEKQKAKDMKKYLTLEEIELFINTMRNLTKPPKNKTPIEHWKYIHELDADMTVILYKTGLRVNELVSMQFSDIKEEKYILRSQVIDGRVHPLKTESSSRDVPLCNDVMNIIEKYWEMTKDIPKATKDWFVFRSDPKRNAPRCPNTFNRNRKTVLKEIQKTNPDFQTFIYHDIRHTFITNCAMKGVNPRAVADFVGHSTCDVTMEVYTHSTKQDEENIKNIFDGIKL